MIGCAVMLSSAIHPVTATSRSRRVRAKTRVAARIPWPGERPQLRRAATRAAPPERARLNEKECTNQPIHQHRDAARELKRSSRCALAPGVLPQPSCQPRHRRSSRRETQPIRGIIRSGVALLDDWLAGVARRWRASAHRRTGKRQKHARASLCRCRASPRRDRVAMLVHARADDVKSHANYLGIDLDSAAARRPARCCFAIAPTSSHRATHAVSPENRSSPTSSASSRRTSPARIIIDTFSPFVCRRRRRSRRSSPRSPSSSTQSRKHVAAHLSRGSVGRLRSQPRAARAERGRDHPSRRAKTATFGEPSC